MSGDELENWISGVILLIIVVGIPAALFVSLIRNALAESKHKASKEYMANLHARIEVLIDKERQPPRV